MKRLSFNPFANLVYDCDKSKCPHIRYRKKLFGLIEVPYCIYYGAYIALRKEIPQYMECYSWKEDITESALYQYVRSIEENRLEYENWCKDK